MNLSKIFPSIKSFRQKTLDHFIDPEVIFSQVGRKTYSALLCGKGNRDNARYAYIGINPFLKVKHHGTKATVNFHNRDASLAVDPFHLLGEALNFYPLKTYPHPLSLWGAIGYLSYDAAHFIENLPKTTIDDLNMPILEIVYYQDMLIFDYQQKIVFLVQVDFGDGFNDPEDFQALFKKKRGAFNNYTVESPKSCCSEEQYVGLIKKIIDYIKKGDVYEVNLAHRFEAQYHGDPYGIFFNLFQINSAPFSAFLNFGDTIIISNSPERFLKADGNQVETRPIKGTMCRGKTKEEDQINRLLLAGSEKEDAELSMIVDLLRNDLGKVCDYGSVRVREHKRIEGFSNVWHLISIVEGRLRKDESYASLIRACFPGGSITGCPKIRSMEIIDELEKYARNLYTGMIFIGNDHHFDSSIVIRTIIAKTNRLYFNVGGAVVYDSIPKREYEETLEKAQSIMKALL
ncbi:MAG TPA: anthranilate synthase component I family protein [Thermodesulfobacteriota bacterium]|nr:anthranilate synthase component I family protein [Thermodesulfobacteriota bacterium]